MEKIKAVWHGIPYHDVATDKWLITFEIEQQPTDYDKLKDKHLSLTVKQWREGRSLNANAYFHVLVGKIAEVMGVSHTEIHNQMIAEYGEVDYEVKSIIMKDSIPWQRLQTIHLRPTTNTSVLDDGNLWRVYQVMRGSHTYDQKEMSRLIDGTVFEAKELGIETMTSNEIKKMLSIMEVNNGKQK